MISFLIIDKLKFGVLIKFREPFPVEAVTKSKKKAGNNADNDENGPDEWVVASRKDENGADSVLCQRGKKRIDYAGNAADPSPVGGRNPLGSIGVVAENGNHFADGIDEHTDKQKPNGFVESEKNHTGGKKKVAEGHFRNFGKADQQNRKKRRQKNDGESVKRIEVAVNGGTGLSHGLDRKSVV